MSSPPKRPLPTVSVRPARAEHRPAVERLLAAAGLPLAGIAEHFGAFLVATTAEGVTGAVGMEYHGPYALLRSLVVSPEARGRGVGGLLAARALEDARRRGARAIYLLTTTATDYFPRFGFAPVARAAVPPELGASEELRGACPAGAVVMVLRLGE